MPISKLPNPERPRAVEALAEAQAREQNSKIRLRKATADKEKVGP